MPTAKLLVGFGHIVGSKTLWGLTAQLLTSFQEPLSIMRC